MTAKYKILLAIFICLLLKSQIKSQEKYWVFFKSKKSENFDPYQYFSAKTIERRLKINYPLNHYTDLPVNENYINEIKKIIPEITTVSRWFNAIAIVDNENKISEIERFPFVTSIQPIVAIATLSEYSDDKPLSNTYQKLLERQIQHLDGQLFKENNITGKGIRIAVFDGGFPDVDIHPVFRHLWERKQIIATYDFVRKREFVYGYNTHGTKVLSCITGIYDNQHMGLAPDAEFLLARTEIKAETFAEEENWLAAAEWADRNGADIINSSLGYTFHRYFPKQMDGKTSLVVRAANMAASKGILIINSVGNDGNNDWTVLSTPADADSVLAIGGIQPNTGFHAGFSSYGPTADFRLKPNVCAFGQVMAAAKKGIKRMHGTSFAAPLIAGFAACVWQLNPKATNMEIFHKIENAASLYPYFDYAHGYGIPQAGYFFADSMQNKINPTFEFRKSRNHIKVMIKPDMITKKLKENNYLYYHIRKPKSYIESFYVIEVMQEEALKIPIEEYEGKILMVHFKGYTNSIKIKD